MINVLQLLLFRRPSSLRTRQRREYAMNPAGWAVHLQSGKVIGLAKSSGVTRLEVRRGLVWLTGTPGGMDLVLRSGEGWELTGNWPVVVEALESAELILERGSKVKIHDDRSAR